MIPIILLMFFQCCSCYEMVGEKPTHTALEDNTLTADTAVGPQKDVETIIRNIESLEWKMMEGDLPEDELQTIQTEIMNDIDDLSALLTKYTHLQKFIEVKGLLKVFSNTLHNDNTVLRIKLLLLLKYIFNNIPKTMQSVVPINILDRLLDIFENDDNLALKAHAIDIMKKWLPDNPEAQVRVMKVKGLDVFYDQINKLDIGVIESIMELFIRIIKEHLLARKEMQEGLPMDERLLMYQRIGLIERLSIKNVCDGMLNIFNILWSHNSLEHGNFKTFFDLLKVIKQFCSEAYARNSKAADFFQALLKHAKYDSKTESFAKKGVDVNEFIEVVSYYLEHIQKDMNKDEF